MDEKDELVAAGHSPEIAELPVAHQTNDILYGHLGRLFYESSDNAEHLGVLSFNRETSISTSTSTRLRQLAPFEQLYPGNGTPLSPAFSRSWLARRSQKAYLFQHHPEAFLGSNLLGEDGFTDDADGSSTNSLISVGEITDVTTSQTRLACSAIASVTGLSRQFVRIATTNGFEDGGNGNLSFVASSSLRNGEVAEGYWSQGPAPISQIRFAVHVQKFETVRWLVVQKDGYLTFLEPVLQRLTVPSEPWEDGLLRRGRRQIAVRELFALPADHAGFRQFADFSLRFVDGKPPLLAAIDGMGAWAVWEICGRRGVRDATYRPRLVHRGDLVSEAAPALEAETVNAAFRPQVVWLSVGQQARDLFSLKLERDSPDYKPASPEHSKKSDLLCINTPEAVHFVRPVDASRRHAFRLLDGNTAERVIAVQNTFLDHAQIFLLTTNRLVWINLAVDDRLRSTVVLSCPHWRGVLDDSLQIAAAPVSSGAGNAETCVLLLSSQSLILDVFWFRRPDRGEFRHQTFYPLPDRLPTSLSIRSLAFRAARVSTRNTEADDASGATIEVAMLGTDLSVFSVAISEIPRRRQHSEVKPLKRFVAARYNPQRDMVRRFEHSFVISNAFTKSSPEDMAAQQQGASFVHPALSRSYKGYAPEFCTLVQRILGQAHRQIACDEEATKAEVAQASQVLYRLLSEALEDGKLVYDTL
jgi:RNA polymerase I-specific transcription initiation factor RRN6